MKEEILENINNWLKSNKIEDTPTIKKATKEGYWIYKHNDSYSLAKTSLGFFVEDTCLEYNDFTEQLYLFDTLEMIIYEAEFDSSKEDISNKAAEKEVSEFAKLSEIATNEIADESEELTKSSSRTLGM